MSFSHTSCSCSSCVDTTSLGASLLLLLRMVILVINSTKACPLASSSTCIPVTERSRYAVDKHEHAFGLVTEL